MSKYENYSNVCNSYSENRKPVGAELIYNIIYENNFKRILDIGCGTGSYLLYLKNKDKTLELFGIDSSKSMLEKITNVNTSCIQLKKDTVLLYKNIDMIIINQVIHHLDDDVIQNLLYNCKKILSEKGFLYINTSTPEQVEKSLWWTQYFTKSMTDKFTNKLKRANLHIQKYPHTPYIISDVCQRNYYQYEAVFTKEFRDCDSMWRLLTADELNQVLNNIKADTTLSLIDESEKNRIKYGQTISYVINKNVLCRNP